MKNEENVGKLTRKGVIVGKDAVEKLDDEAVEIIESQDSLPMYVSEDMIDELKEQKRRRGIDNIDVVEAAHLERSSRARTVDEKRRADTVFDRPLTDEEVEEWSENKDRVDVAGVDAGRKVIFEEDEGVEPGKGVPGPDKGSLAEQIEDQGSENFIQRRGEPVIEKGLFTGPSDATKEQEFENEAEVQADLPGIETNIDSERVFPTRSADDEDENNITPFTASSRLKEDEETYEWQEEDVENAREVVEEVQSDRSPRAKSVDREYNAPVTRDIEAWAQNPNRYDLVGVDTIPPGERMSRAKQIAGKAEEQEGFRLDRFEIKGNAKRLRGKFSPRGNKTYGPEDVIRVQKSADEKGRVLAHELGHAFDYSKGGGRYGISSDIFEDEQIAEEAERISKRMRGSYKSQSPKHKRYRKSNEEQVADAISSLIVEPRAAKREAPNLSRKIEEGIEEDSTLAKVLGI